MNEAYCTVIVDVPLFPSDVAVIVTCPGVAPGVRVTVPVPPTLARKTLLEDQSTVRPVKTFPAASFSVAVS
jgi:hypothetical protein